MCILFDFLQRDGRNDPKHVPSLQKSGFVNSSFCSVQLVILNHCSGKLRAWMNKAAARAYENVVFRRPCPSEASRVFVHQSVSVRSDAIGAAHGHFCFAFFFPPSLAVRIHGYQRNKQQRWARPQQQDWSRVLAFMIIYTNYAARGSNCGQYCSLWKTQST